MGTADAEADERPVHRVHVSEFFIGRFPVSNDEYARFLRATGYPTPAIRELPMIAAGDRGAVFREMATPYVWDDGSAPAGRGSHPIVLIKYEDAVAYCDWLADVTARQVRLPSEAEWEKAARGGVEAQRYPWGNDIDPSNACYLNDPAAKRQRGTKPLGMYAPNSFGVYDMSGNVWEWVSDWYGADYYGSGDRRDPKGPPTGSMRIVRGGSWVNSDVRMLRSAYRHRVPPDTYAYSV